MKSAVESMKLKVMVITDDGTMLCHETAKKNKTSTQKCQNTKSVPTTNEHDDQNKLDNK